MCLQRKGHMRSQQEGSHFQDKREAPEETNLPAP